MQLLAIIVSVVAILTAGEARAGDVGPKGTGYVDTNRPKLGKNYYVVREQDGQCSIQTGAFNERPDGTLGDAPYASKKFAKAALKRFPECRQAK